MSNFVIRTLRFWFQNEGRVGRGAYAATGFGLMAAKFMIDAAMVHVFGSAPWSPLYYLQPILATRQRALGNDELLVAMAVATLPFLWLALSLTLRRALDAG